jgi:hypothetical protein
MRFLTLLSLVLVFGFSSSALASPPEPAAVPKGNVAGHVWIDTNCDGIKDQGEGDAANLGIVQLVNAGDDRVLNSGDRAETYFTDTKGNWEAKNRSVNHILDGQPLVYAVAVGKGSAAALGYKPSPEGPDNILKGPTFASATFQLQDGQTLNVGEIGVCPLPKVFLPAVRK